MSDQPPIFDTKEFKTRSYTRRIDKPWGFEVHLTPSNLPYMLKEIHINPNAKLSLQVHDTKQETWTKKEGDAKVIWENEKGELVETILEEGVGYTCAVGQRHRLAAGDKGCVVVEASTPEEGITWRLEDDYNRPHETEEQRALERNGM